MQSDNLDTKHERITNTNKRKDTTRKIRALHPGSEWQVFCRFSRLLVGTDSLSI